MAFAEGCFAALRNPVGHEHVDMDETEALDSSSPYSVFWLARFRKHALFSHSLAASVSPPEETRWTCCRAK